MELNKTESPLGRVSHRAPFSVPCCFLCTSMTESEIRLFADYCVCYHEIKDMEDTLKLQKDMIV